MARGEDADAEGAEETTHTVHGPDVERVVEVVLLREFDARVAPRHAERTDDERGPRLDERGARGDGGQTSDSADARADEGGLAFDLPLEHEPEEESGGGGDFRVHRGERGRCVRRKGGAAVETEPAEPEKTGAEGDERDVVRVGVDVCTLELSAVRAAPRRWPSAEKPAVMCTTMPPAKSLTPLRAIQPPPHTQWANGKYTKWTQKKMKRRYGTKRTRSANAPVMRRGAMTANMPWNPAKTSPGHVPGAYGNSCVAKSSRK